MNDQISKICLQQNAIFIKFENPRIFKIKSATFCLSFTMYVVNKEKNVKLGMVAKCPESLVK